ncbi:hypothetical protein BABINDRAFT_59093 [Babjeviella inositovora NRRL Y-12698]|uniref:Pyruvate decarboxylase n=1 Tax=Babjeviella inositovora NRRL Y-12698 TaxID=984486 RepID=A0A1E3QWL9_9ASCO|nr:uncharacterized protein BABINDRAFT_59093 [Babjeviella inositovora NRRL Y-12698]ODQ82078.1 hypothetical protein BABINDRAFT_59093 [Babjeviella inositovora NRRL Y-12698]
MDISLGEYLFARLAQLSVHSIFGVPGDFSLALLDTLPPTSRWVGNANELNAAYAADGYLRVTGLACLVTSFGSGELSALNGVAGAYAEHVALLHVVGVPSIAAQAKQLLRRHTLGNGDFTVFHRMAQNVAHTTAFLNDIRTAPAEIDRCIREAYLAQRPVYVGLPANLVAMRVPASRLAAPLDLTRAPNDSCTEHEVVAACIRLMRAAHAPVVVVDAGAARHGCKRIAARLVDATQFPVFVTPMGKGGVDEQHPRFGGVFVGTLSYPAVRAAVDAADLVLSIGGLMSDFSTSSFSYRFSTKNVVEFHADYVKVKTATYPGVQMKVCLEELLQTDSQGAQVSSLDPLGPLPQDYLWSRLGSWLREDDIVITETGTSAFGVIQTRFPDRTLGISQVLWGSVGFTVGATLGAVLAAEETDTTRRVILFVGDGSLQLTVQEISTMVRWGTKPYLFVMNNDGSTIDRLLHGNASYNDIQPWDNLALLPLFNAVNYETRRVSTPADVDVMFEDAGFANNDRIRMVEVMLPRMDAPLHLQGVEASLGESLEFVEL